MAQQMATILQPSCYSQFRCLAGECKETCCTPDWKVAIEREAYQKYKLIRPGQPLYDQFQSGVKKVRKNASKRFTAMIVMNDKGRCPFQAESGLCQLQNEYGEDYLCYICRHYPRTYYEVDGVVHRGLDVSCEAVAQLILCQKDGMAFEYVTERAPICPSSQYSLLLNSQHPNFRQTAKHYFLPLRTFAIDLLQNRSFSISERMLILGMIMKDVQQCIDEKKVEDIPAVLQKYGGGALPREALAAQLNSVPYRADMRTYTYHGVLSAAALISYLNRSEKTKEQLLTFANTGLLMLKDHTSDEDFAQASQQFEQAYRKIYLPFNAKHDYIMENLLVNYVFNNHFPVHKADKLYEEYLNLFFTYLLNQTAMISYGLTAKGLNVEVALRAIEFISRNFQHSSYFVKAAEFCQQHYQLDNMAHIGAVLKEPAE